MRWDLLVVEDDHTMADLLAELAREAGFDARTATNCRGALDEIARQPPEVLFTDLRLPDGDGVEIIRAAKRLTADIPAVLITGYASVPDVVAAFRAGALDLLTKPFEPAQIIQVLDRILDMLSQRRRFQALVKRLDTLDSAPERMIAESAAMREVAELAERVSAMDVPVLLGGETGTGKGVLARLIHDLSPRAGGPWFAVNCGAVSAALAESELFGHEKGAFTGAMQRKLGLLELGDGGTLFLDEINSASSEIQTRLLQFVHDHTLLRVGGRKPISVDTRIITASNQPLRDLVARGRFREDLFFRLNVFPIEIPPLRERRDDILPIAQQMLARCCLRMHCTAREISPSALRLLLVHSWPGNVRELESLIQRAAILCTGDTLEPSHLPTELSGDARTTAVLGQFPDDCTLADLERLWIDRTLQRTGGNKSEAARRLGIDASTLHRKLKG